MFETAMQKMVELGHDVNAEHWTGGERGFSNVCLNCGREKGVLKSGHLWGAALNAPCPHQRWYAVSNNKRQPSETRTKNITDGTEISGPRDSQHHPAGSGHPADAGAHRRYGRASGFDLRPNSQRYGAIPGILSHSYHGGSSLGALSPAIGLSGGLRAHRTGDKRNFADRRYFPTSGIQASVAYAGSFI